MKFTKALNFVKAMNLYKQKKRKKKKRTSSSSYQFVPGQLTIWLLIGRKIKRILLSSSTARTKSGDMRMRDWCSWIAMVQSCRRDGCCDNRIWRILTRWTLSRQMTGPLIT